MCGSLGTWQSTVNACELGHQRVPVSALPLLARTLGVSVEELIGEDSGRPGAQARAQSEADAAHCR